MFRLIPLLLALPVGFAFGGERPNILFIIADDQSPFDLKVYNERSTLDTPNIDRLAAEGTVIDQAYHMGAWVSGVCTPSRHMIMSGRTLWHIPDKPGRDRNPHVHDPLKVPPDLPDYTMAAVFNRAGYDTMRTCKTGNSYEEANERFTVRHDAMKREGTHEGGSGWHGDRVIEYLEDRERRGDEDPFLIYFGFSHPHDVRDGTPELLRKYGATNHSDIDALPQIDPDNPPPALPINYLAKHPFPHGHPASRDENKVSGLWSRRDEASVRNEMGREYACSENIDIQIGRVLDQLEAMGELENTYVIYTSDHGIAIGRHGLQGKQNLYEPSWRVPYIVMGPGVRKDARAKGNIYLLDTLATLCDFAGVEPPKTNEGLSFKSVVEGRRETVREVLYGVFGGATLPGMRAVRKGDWKLLKFDVLDGLIRRTLLFNLKENPWELLVEHQDPNMIELIGNRPGKHQVDLSNDPRYADKLSEMEAILLEQMRRHDDPFRLWNQPSEK